jgi:hypothetical protein
MDPHQELRVSLVRNRLRGATPIWENQRTGWQLFQSRDGIYVIHYPGTGGVLYLAIKATTGEVKDVSGAAIEPPDISIAMGTFSQAGLDAMQVKVREWWNTHQG